MKGSKRVKSNRERSQSPVWKMLRPIVFSILAGAVVCIALLLVLSLILVVTKQLPQSLLQPIIVLTAALGAFFAGYTIARIPGGRGMLRGVDSALLLSGLLFLAGLTVSGESVSAPMLTKDLIMVLTGAIAGILSVNRKSKRKQIFQVPILVL